MTAASAWAVGASSVSATDGCAAGAANPARPTRYPAVSATSGPAPCPTTRRAPDRHARAPGPRTGPGRRDRGPAAARLRAPRRVDDRTTAIPSCLLLPVSEQGAQPAPPVEHFGSHRAFRDAEDRGDLGVRIALDVEQHHGCAPPFGELRERLA